MIGIYKITSPSNRVYIGQSVDIKKRFRKYELLHSSVKVQVKLYNSFVKYGIDKHNFEIIEECEISELNDKERYYQDVFECIGKNGLNCRLTKSTDRSGRVSEETKAKIKELNSKKVNYFFGQKHSKETIEKMRISSTGKKHSEETKRKMSLGRMGNKNRLGIPHSDEIKEKISKAGIGRKISERHRKILSEKRARIIFDINSFVFYSGLKEVSELYGINYSVLANNLNGTNKVNRTHFIYV